MDISGNIIQDEMLIRNHILHNMIHNYNENINYYNSNIRHMINILERDQVYQYNLYNNSNINNSNINASNNYNYYNQYQPNIQTQMRQQNSRSVSQLFQRLLNLQDVIVRPTSIQINTAVEFLLNTNADLQCPITLESIGLNQEICKIKHCGHCFKKDALLRWFERNVRCPVCRYDIRDYVPTVTQSNNTSSQTNNLENSDSGSDSSSDSGSELPELEEENAGVTESIETNSTAPININSLPPNINNLTNTIRQIIMREMQDNPEFTNVSFDIMF